MATLVLKEEPVAMSTALSGGGDEEEGAIAGPSTELLDNSHEKLKVCMLVSRYVCWSPGKYVGLKISMLVSR